MIRTGIYRLDQLDHAALKDVFGKEKNISIYLYHKINKIDDPVKRVQYAEIILNRFNSDRNVIKRTYENRFNKFDDISIVKILEQNYKNTSVFDIAISDGRASCHFLEQSINKLKDFSYCGSDIQIYYYLHKKNSSSKSYIITDYNNTIIEIIQPPFVWNLARTEGNFYFINNILKQYYLKRAQSSLLKADIKYQEKIELLHHDFKALLSKGSNFNVCNYSLFENIPGKFNVIRAMNILHQGYFSRDQLSLILNNICNGLEINGLLIEGSNEEAGTHVEGAIYRKSETGFTLISQPEKPSRIKEQIISFMPIPLNE